MLIDVVQAMWVTWIAVTTEAVFESYGVSLNLSGQLLQIIVKGVPGVPISMTHLGGFMALKLAASLYRLFMVVPIWKSAGKFQGLKLWLALARISVVVVAWGNLQEPYGILAFIKNFPN